MSRLTIAAVFVLAYVSTARAEVVIDTVSVGNPGNAGELSGEGAGGFGADRICGAVDYVYNIAKFEVTAGQYTEFLNAVAANDTYGVYNPDMWSDPPFEKGCKIERTGSSPNYSYSVGAEWAHRPVNFVSWGDAARFANWLHNGQPTGAQGLSTTEDGSYFLNGAMTDADLLAVVREPDATWVIPSEDEWYKAAYHYNDGVTGNYYDYPTESDTAPTSEAPPGTDMANGSANYYGSDFAIGSPYYRTQVGAYDAKPSDSPYGTFDQGGNVSEWNEAVLYISYRGLRGGSYGSAGAGAFVLYAAMRGSNHPQSEFHSVGFRIAGVSEPGPVCGNGVSDPGEECDGMDDTACPGACLSDCTCGPFCGNGVCDPGEECDGGLGCTDCLCDANFEPTAPPSLDCQPTCGNGSVDPGEECDGMDDTACPGACLSDCTCGPFCGDGACDPGEDSCNCPDDCGTPPASETPGSTCSDGLDNDCDGFMDSDDPDCGGQVIPAVSQWGLLIVALILLTLAKTVYARRQGVAA